MQTIPADLLIQQTTNTILAIITSISLVLTALVLLYYKLKALVAAEQKQSALMLMEEIRKTREEVKSCIHKIPGHPDQLLSGDEKTELSKTIPS